MRSIPRMRATHIPALYLGHYNTVYLTLVSSAPDNMTILTALAVLASTSQIVQAGTWSKIDSPTFQSNSIAIQVSFSKENDGVGFFGGGNSGCPAHIQKTTDHGKTWSVVWPAGNCTRYDFNLFLSAATRDAEHAVVGGSFFQMWTGDGSHFNSAINNFGSPPQDAGIIPGSNKFALVSGKETVAGGNSVDVSDSGLKYTRISIPDTVINSTEYLARYGAFPSESTWYVTAGDFGSSINKEESSLKKLSKHFSVDTKSGSIRFHSDESSNSANRAAIVKTSDGGKSWELVYKNDNSADNIYPNGIHCSSDNHCVAVLEGDSSRILVTRDGGKSWNETLHDNDPHSSLFAVRMVSEDEVWAVGGHPSGKFEGRFWHSLDGGATWKKTAFPGYYVVSLDMVSPSQGYAVAWTSGSPAGVNLFRYQD